MATILTDTKDMTRDAWLAARRQGLGSSDAAAVCGVDPWKSPVQVFLDKLGASDDRDSEPMEWGRRLESEIARGFQEKTGFPTKRRNAILQHPDHPFMLANLDRLTKDDSQLWVPCEVKNVSAWKADDWADDQVPDHYYLQVQHQIAVVGAPHAWIAALVGGNHFVKVRIPRDDQIIAYLIAIETAFWENVERKVPPAIDGSESTTETLKRLYPNADPMQSIWLTAEEAADIARYHALGAQIKDLTDTLDTIRNQFRMKLGSASAAFVEGHAKPVITYRNGSKLGFDRDAFMAAHPDLYQTFCTKAPGRTLRINPLKEAQ